MRSVLWATVISTALLAPPYAVFAQAFPGKLVRFVIPFPVGGSSDANARSSSRRSWGAGNSRWW